MKWIPYFAVITLLLSGCAGAIKEHKVKTDLMGENTWSRTFGSFFFPDLGHTVRECSDGYIAGGMTIRFPYIEQHGWLLKLNKKGGREWSMIIKDTEDLMDVEIAKDGIISGGYGKDGDLKILKTDFDGNIIWKKSYGGKYLDMLEGDGCISLTEDGGCVVLSTSWSFSNNRGADMWLLKLDENGEREWETVYGNVEDADIGYGVVEVEDGYIMVGQSFSFNYTEYGIIIKSDKNGNILWEKRTGYVISDAVPDGNGCIATGGIYNEKKHLYNIMTMKIDGNGNIIWLQTYEDSINGMGNSLDETDDGYIICGSCGYDIDADILLIKIDGEGNELWHITHGKKGLDMGECVKYTTDHGYIVAGATTSFPWLFFPYRLNMWIIKTDKEGKTSFHCIR